MSSFTRSFTQHLSVLSSIAVLAACGGGGGTPATTPTYSVGGTLSGLSAGKSVSISLNGSAPVALTANGVYTSGAGLTSGANYAVTVAAQPDKAICTVTNGTGTIGSANVSNVAVNCVDTIVTASLNTGTGAVGVLATPNARIVFVPGASGIFPVVVETNNGTTVKAANLTTRALPTLVATSFAIDACALDSDAVVAICYGYSNSKIATMDLLKFSTTLVASDIKLTEFDTGITNYASFSGGSCIICSVALDIGKKRFAIATSTGYSIYAYGATVKTASYAMPVNENFSLLPGKVFTKLGGNSYLISPDYDSTYNASLSIYERKLRVVNIDTGLTFVWNKDTASVGDLGAGSSGMVNSEVDSVAVDPVTGMIVMAFEAGNDLLMVDFGQAVFNANNTFSAPMKINTATSSVSGRQTGVAITSTDSLAFTTQEFGSTVGATQLAKQTGTGGVFASGTGSMGILSLSASQFNLSASPCAISSWSGKGDPHGMGLFTSLSNTPIGISLNSTNTCAAIIDLKAMSTFPRKVGSNDLDTTAPGFASLVKFVKVN